MKIAPYLITCCLLTAPIACTAADTDALLGKQAPDVVRSPKNYEEMVANIESVTGFKVKIDPPLAAFMKTIATSSWSSGPGGGSTGITTLKDYLRRETMTYCLRCELDADTRTVLLLPAWQRDDGRGAGELLKALRAAYETQSKMPRKKNDLYTQSWIDAHKPCGLLLNALLSKKENYEKAWKTRTLSLFKPDPLEYIFPDAPDIFMASDLVDTTGRHAALVLVKHAISIMPGHGGFSYYYFTGDGLLLSSGLFGAGGDCGVDSASVGKGKAGAFSDLAVKVSRLGETPVQQVVQKFAMEPDGLVLKEIIMRDGTVLTGQKMKDTCMGFPITDAGEPAKP